MGQPRPLKCLLLWPISTGQELQLDFELSPFKEDSEGTENLARNGRPATLRLHAESRTKTAARYARAKIARIATANEHQPNRLRAPNIIRF